MNSSWNSYQARLRKVPFYIWDKLATAVIFFGVAAAFYFYFIPAYEDYLRRAAWNRTISSVSRLKLAIAECLNNNSGNAAVCNDFSAAKLGKYHATLPISTGGEISSISIMQNAGIKIIGLEPLGMCNLDIVPTVFKAEGIISFNLVMQTPGTDKISTEKCRAYIYQH